MTSALDYSKYTLSKFRTIAIARTSDSSHKQTKSFKNTTKDKLAKLLRRLDANPTFRFFDLPLELREQIYSLFLERLRGSVSLEELEPRLQLVSPQFCHEVSAVANRAPYNLTSIWRDATPSPYSAKYLASWFPPLAPDAFMGPREEKPKPSYDDVHGRQYGLWNWLENSRETQRERHEERREAILLEKMVLWEDRSLCKGLLMVERVRLAAMCCEKKWRTRRRRRFGS